MEISPRSREQARHLLDFIDASPSPWHAVETIADYLRRAGFVALGEDERWQLAAGGRYFVIRGGASIVAFVVGRGHLDTCGITARMRPPHRFLYFAGCVDMWKSANR